MTGMPQIGEVDRQMAVDALAGGDDAVDALVEHRLDMKLGEARIVLDIAQEDRDAVVDQRIGNSGHHRQREAAVGIVGEQPDGEAALAQQALRQAVRPKAQTLRRLADALARLGRHPPLAVERLRRRRDADAGRRGDLTQGDRGLGGRWRGVGGHGGWRIPLVGKRFSLIALRGADW